MRPDIEQLKHFTPFQDLTDGELELIAANAKLHKVAGETQLLKQGSEDHYSLFLVEGVLKLTAADGRTTTISNGHPSSLLPIAQLIPRRYDVVTLATTTYFTINQEILNRIHANQHLGLAGDSYVVTGDVDEEDETEVEHELIARFLSDLERDRFSLPSLPDVALRIGRALRDDLTDAHQIAAMIQTDPVIAAKLIKAANSALYVSRAPVETCTAAVIRLGTDVTHNLVVAYSVSELFRTDSPVVERLMKGLWQHSVRVASICYVLAKHDSRFIPEQAMLIGLLHDIGVIAVYNYVTHFPKVANEKRLVQSIAQRLRGQVGSQILRRWSFAPEFIVAALEAELWQRDNGHQVDYCDLLIIAQLHSFIGTENALKAPAIDQVPAHSKFAFGELTPDKTLQILEGSKELLHEAEALLSIGH